MAPSMKLLLLSASLIPFLTSNAQEDIRLPPSIIEGPEKQVFYAENARGILRCVASGHPLPTMSWRKNGQDLAFVGIIPAVLPPGNGTIEIVQMNASHVGRYQCIASNEHGSAMTLASALDLATLSPYDPNDGNRIANRSVQANGALRLSCNPPPSAPQASITWTWNSTRSPLQTPVSPSKNAHVDYNGDLCFASVNLTETQGRLYRCNVFNEPKQATSSGSYTRITGDGSISNAAPQLVFRTTPNPYVALRSTQTVLRCFFSGTGQMSYQWTYNGAVGLPVGWTAADTDLLSPQTGTPVSDAGTFTCFGSNGQGPAASASITLTVEALPEFGAHGPGAIGDVNVTDGDQLTLSCSSDALPSASVQWYKNTQPFDANSLPAKFSLSSDRLTLKIVDVCKNCSDGSSDLMVIQCIATNKHGSTLAQGYVNVLQPTVIDSESTSVPWVSRGTYTFDCLATCDDSTTCSVRWSFDGQTIESDGATLVIADDGSSLTINTRNDTDDGRARIGRYECTANNGYSQQTIACTIDAPTVETAELWWVGLIVALLVLLLLLLVLCCCFFCFCREGKSYPVDKNERKNGNDPEKELLEIGFQDYMHSKNRPVDTYASPVYGVADVMAPPPIYKGPFVDYTDHYSVNQDRSTPLGSRKGGHGGSGDSPAPCTEETKSAFRAVNGNHSWNSSEV